MKFNVNIRPSVYTGSGTHLDAMNRFHSVIPARTCLTFCSNGNFYGPIKKSNSSPDYAYCFNMDVFKRGKHRKNKHYTLYVYKIDLRLLDILDMKIDQHQRYFRIVPKKK